MDLVRRKMKAVFTIILALAACALAKPHHSLLLPVSPDGVTVHTAVLAPNCRETFQTIETKFCEPTFEIVCERYHP